MRIITLCAAVVLAGGTVQQDKTEAATSPTPTSAAEPAARAPELEPTEGRWQVERVDGAPPGINIAGYAPGVTIDARRKEPAPVSALVRVANLQFLLRLEHAGTHYVG